MKNVIATKSKEPSFLMIIFVSLATGLIPLLSLTISKEVTADVPVELIPYILESKMKLSRLWPLLAGRILRKEDNSY